MHISITRSTNTCAGVEWVRLGLTMLIQQMKYGRKQRLHTNSKSTWTDPYKDHHIEGDIEMAGRCR